MNMSNTKKTYNELQVQPVLSPMMSMDPLDIDYFEITLNGEKIGKITLGSLYKQLKEIGYTLNTKKDGNS